MNWLKLYHDLRTDRKVETLADDEFRVFINLLLFASEQDDHRGDITGVDDDLIALEVCRGDVALLLRTLDKLRRLRVVSVVEGVTRYIAFLHFAERQARKPSDEPDRILERVHKHRQAKRNAPDQESNASVTRYVTPPVTPVTPRNAHREEGEGEEDSSPTEKRSREAGASAPHQEVVNSWLQAIGRDPAKAKDYGRYVAVGAEMAGRGDTPQDVGNCTRYLSTDPWRQEKSKAPSLTDVRDALPMWRDSGRPAKVPIKANAPPPRKATGQDYLAWRREQVRAEQAREEADGKEAGLRRLPGGATDADYHALPAERAR